MALTADKDRQMHGGDVSREPLTASNTPYSGSAMVRAADGYVELLTSSNKDRRFAGFARARVTSIDWFKDTDSDGDVSVPVQAGIFIALLTISGIARDDVAHRRHVYATDDDTFTFTASGNCLIGQVIGLQDGKAVVLCATDGYQGVLEGNEGVRTISATETLTTADLGKTILLDTQGGAFTTTLPPAADCTGRRLTFVRAGTGVNAATLDGSGAETINGNATYAAMDAQYDTVTIESDGSEWRIVAANVA